MGSGKHGHRRQLAWRCLLILTLLLSCIAGAEAASARSVLPHAASSISLTPSEEAWRREHPIVQVGVYRR